MLRTLKSLLFLKTELLAGLVVSLALIFEAAAFTVIAGVDPRMGIFASFTISVVIAFTGERAAMISAVAGAVAVVVAPLVRTYGVECLFATVVLGRRHPGKSGVAGGSQAAALHPVAGDNRLRQRPAQLDLLGAHARAAQRPLDGVPAGSPRGAHRDHDLSQGRRSHRGRQGRAARFPAVLPPARRAAGS